MAVRDTLRRVGPLALAVLGVVLVVSIPAGVWLAVAKPTIAGGLNPNGLWALLGLGPVVAAVLGFGATAGAARGGAAPTTNSG